MRVLSNGKKSVTLLSFHFSEKGRVMFLTMNVLHVQLNHVSTQVF